MFLICLSLLLLQRKNSFYFEIPNMVFLPGTDLSPTSSMSSYSFNLLIVTPALWAVHHG